MDKIIAALIEVVRIQARLLQVAYGSQQGNMIQLLADLHVAVADLEEVVSE